MVRQDARPIGAHAQLGLSTHLVTPPPISSPVLSPVAVERSLAIRRRTRPAPAKPRMRSHHPAFRQDHSGVFAA